MRARENAKKKTTTREMRGTGGEGKRVQKSGQKKRSEKKLTETDEEAWDRGGEGSEREEQEHPGRTARRRHETPKTGGKCASQGPREQKACEAATVKGYRG